MYAVIFAQPRSENPDENMRAHTPFADWRHALHFFSAYLRLCCFPVFRFQFPSFCAFPPFLTINCSSSMSLKRARAKKMSTAFSPPPCPTCPLCAEVPKEPSQLACGHVICGLCLEGLQRADEIACPICGTNMLPAAAAAWQAVSTTCASGSKGAKNAVAAAVLALIPQFQRVADATAAVVDDTEERCTRFMVHIREMKTSVCTALDKAAAANVHAARQAAKLRKKTLEATADQADITVSQLRSALAMVPLPLAALQKMQAMVVPPLPRAPPSLLDFDDTLLAAAIEDVATAFTPHRHVARLCSTWKDVVSTEQFTDALHVAETAPVLTEEVAYELCAGLDRAFLVRDARCTDNVCAAGLPCVLFILKAMRAHPASARLQTVACEALGQASYGFCDDVIDSVILVQGGVELIHAALLRHDAAAVNAVFVLSNLVVSRRVAVLGEEEGAATPSLLTTMCALVATAGTSNDGAGLLQDALIVLSRLRTATPAQFAQKLAAVYQELERATVDSVKGACTALGVMAEEDALAREEIARTGGVAAIQTVMAARPYHVSVQQKALRALLRILTGNAVGKEAAVELGLVTMIKATRDLFGPYQDILQDANELLAQLE